LPFIIFYIFHISKNNKQKKVKKNFCVKRNSSAVCRSLDGYEAKLYIFL